MVLILARTLQEWQTQVNGLKHQPRSPEKTAHPSYLPMDREAMNALILFDGDALRPIPQDNKDKDT